MQSSAKTPDEYLNELPEDRKLALSRLREIFTSSLSEGFEEVMSSGMINYVVSYAFYPPGYHCKPKQPLPFLAIASQKNFIAVYHMGLYADQALLDWFLENYPLQTSAKLDMGKSCIRFKRSSDIPYSLFEALAKKMSAQQWVEIYEKNYKPSK